MIKVVTDSNILFSAFISQGGIVRKLLTLSEEQKICLGVPKYCVLELEPVFRDKLGESGGSSYRQLKDWIETYAEEIMLPRGKILNRYKEYATDIFDVPVIASAIEWGANYFVTGNIKDYNREMVERHLKLISVRQLLETIQTAERAIP